MMPPSPGCPSSHALGYSFRSEGCACPGATDAKREACSGTSGGSAIRLPRGPQELSAFCAAAQFGLVGPRSSSSTAIDAGAAVVALMFQCPRAACRDDQGMLESLAAMLAELAGHGEATGSVHMRRRLIGHSRSMLFFKEPDDVYAQRRQLDALGARYSWARHADLLDWAVALPYRYRRTFICPSQTRTGRYTPCCYASPMGTVICCHADPTLPYTTLLPCCCTPGVEQRNIPIDHS